MWSYRLVCESVLQKSIDWPEVGVVTCLLGTDSNLSSSCTGLSILLQIFVNNLVSVFWKLHDPHPYHHHRGYYHPLLKKNVVSKWLEIRSKSNSLYKPTSRRNNTWWFVREDGGGYCQVFIYIVALTLFYQFSEVQFYLNEFIFYPK